MFWNYQHNHRGGWNYMSFNQGRFNYPRDHGFYYADNRYPPHQAFGPPIILNAVPPPPHDPYVRRAYNGYPLHRALRPTVPTVVPPLPRTRDKNGKPPHKAPRPTIPAAISPHQTPEPTIPAKVSPHKTLEPTIAAASPPHQTLEPTIPAKVLPHKTLEPTIPDVVPVQQLPANLVCEICDIPLPRKQLEDHKKGKRHRRKVQEKIDHLPRQKTSNGHEAKHTPAIVSPHKMLEPTIPDVVPVQPLPENLVCEICDIPLPRKQFEEHMKGKRHRRKVQEQIDHLPRQKTSNGHEAKHTPAIVSPHKTLEPTIPDVVPVQPLPENLVCEICDIPLPRKQFEEHMKGKRHRRKVQEQIDHLPRQKTSNGHEAKHTPAIVSPHKTLEPTIPDVVPVQPFPENLVCEICDIPLSRKQFEEHMKGKRHRRTVQEQYDHLPRQKTSNGHEAKHTPAIVSPHKTLEPTIPDVVPVQPFPENLVCEICDIPLPRKQFEEHMKGKRHRRTVQEQIDHLPRQKTLDGHEAKHTPAIVSPHKTLEPTIPDVVPVQPLPENLVCGICDIPLSRKQLDSHKKGKRHRRKVEEQIEYLRRQKSSNGHEAKHTPNSQVSAVVQPKEVSKSKENRHEDNIGAKDWCFEVEIVSPIFKSKNVPIVGSERKPLDNSGVKDCSLKRKIGEAKDAKRKYMKMNNEIRKPMKSSKPEVNALSISVKSLVQAPELTPSSKGKEHDEIQNPIEENNDQNQSTPMELQASVVSNVSSETEDMSCDFAAIVVAPPEKHDLQTEMLEGKDHNEIQCKTMVSNVHQQLISVELHAPASSNINSQTEELNSDSLAIEIEQESLTKPHAVGSSFEHQTELVLHTEMEHQVSDAKETDFQMLPSVVMKLDVPSGETTNTQTVGGKDEAKMNVLATDLVIPQMSQVSVCVECGDEGFEEALVYCNKCQIYALHRYCLDGPVVINDDVIWFCEDCEETVADTSSQHQCSLLPLERSDPENSAKELTNCIECEKTNKQRNQRIAAEEEVLPLTYRHSSSHHGKSECLNKSEESEEEKELTKDSQQCPESEADCDEGCVINIDPQPIADPIWRGNLYLWNLGFGTFNGLLAHVSSLACSKVLEEARLFPRLLSANLFQRSTVWPKSFIECGPDHQSIALYFFPESERVERVFDKLVEDMISKDLAISTMVKNADLLIFASTVLPIQYRRFRSKYYLWGVFRAKETSSKTKDVVSEEDNSPIINNNSPSNTLGTSGSNGSSCASNH